MLGTTYASAANLAGYYVPAESYFVWKRSYNSGAVWYIEQKTAGVSGETLLVDQEIYNSSGSQKAISIATNLIESIATLNSYSGSLDEQPQFIAGRQLTVYVTVDFYGERWIDKGSGAIVKFSGRTGEDAFVQELISWNNEDLKQLYGDSSDGGSGGSDELNGYSLWLTLGISASLVAVLIKRRK